MKYTSIVYSMACLVLVAGCGSRSSGDLTLTGDAFATTGAGAARTDTVGALAESDDTTPTAGTPTTDVTEFKVCVSRVRVDNEDDQAEHKDGDDSDDYAASGIGLVDLSTGNAKDWGKINLPVGFKIKRLRVKIKKDKDLCGVNYSMIFNGQTSPQDFELKFVFDPAVDVSSGDVIGLKLDTLVKELRLAADAGQIASLKDRIERKSGTARKK